MKILNRKSVMFIAVGILCSILLLFTGVKKEEIDKEDSVSYEIRAEQKLTELISGLKGVSNVKVMVTLECGTEYVYAENREESSDVKRIEYYSAGESEALLIKEITPVIKGVAVVCDSEDPTVARVKITELVSSVLDLSISRIFVDTQS